MCKPLSFKAFIGTDSVHLVISSLSVGVLDTNNAGLCLRRAACSFLIACSVKCDMLQK